MNAPLSLYIHIPFCDHRCAYCDFNAYAGLDGLMPAYTEALIAEIEGWGGLLGRRAAPTVFFGGGTPSLLPLPLLGRIIEAVRANFDVATDVEWSLEANPGTVDAAYFVSLRALGVNRVSIGAQSFDDRELRRLDRIHDAAAAERAFLAAHAAGFANVNLDLIFGLEGQTLTGWERNLRRAVALAPEHLSLYALTIEDGTPLAHRVARGVAPEPDADLQADMYELAMELLATAGYEQYEISNWAKPGRACRHNLVYWRDGEWLGLGCGAHSHLDGVRFANVKSPASYVRANLTPQPPSLKGRGSTSARADGAPALHDPPLPLPFRGGGWGERSIEPPDPATDMADAVILALRLTEGLSLAAFGRRFGVPFDAVFGDATREFIELRLMERDGDRVRISPRGRLLANEVFARVLAAARCQQAPRHGALL